MTIRKILVPVDGSASANRAAVFAAHLGRQLGAELTLMYVFDAPSAVSLGLVAKGNLDETKQYVSEGSFTAARKAIGAELEEASVREYVDIGDPSHQIVVHAETHGFDLIVMGRRGLSPVKELLMGSVSERVSRRAPCPITIVR